MLYVEAEAWQQAAMRHASLAQTHQLQAASTLDQDRNADYIPHVYMCTCATT